MAIDFTASNGNPADPRSLHYVDPTGMVLNDYAKAMSGIGRVLEFYGERGWEALLCNRCGWRGRYILIFFYALLFLDPRYFLVFCSLNRGCTYIPAPVLFGVN